MPGKPLQILMAAIGLALAACASSTPFAKEASMSATAATSSGLMMPAKEWPLRFKSHSFSVATYDTYDAKVIYAGLVQVKQDSDDLQPSSAGYGPNYQRGWSGGHGLIRNFPPPAIVTWRSKDGQAHKAEIDIGEIFKDERILHNVSREEMADLPNGEFQGEPSITLEVNDRTIRVWMRAMIFLKKRVEVAGVMRADFQDDLILAKTYTF